MKLSGAIKQQLKFNEQCTHAKSILNSQMTGPELTTNPQALNHGTTVGK